MKTRRLLVLVAVVTASVSLGGCMSAPQHSQLDDYRGQAERLTGELIAAIPAELAGSTGMLNSRMTLGADISSHEGAGAPAWWSVDLSVTPAPVANAARDAAAAMAAHLTADGWTEKLVRADDERTVDGFRKDGWYTEIAWYATVAGRAEALDLAIVSPETVRGDH